MVAVLADATQGGILDAANPNIALGLSAYATDYWPPHASDAATTGAFDELRAMASALPVEANGRGILADGTRSYVDDWYYRVHLIPSLLAMGNLVTAQQRTVVVWNAWPGAAVNLVATPLEGGDGIDVVAPSALPIAFAPLQERLWQITVGQDGPPAIDATLTFDFSDAPDAAVRITGVRVQGWVWPPDWREPVEEDLAWLTEVQRAEATGSEARTPLRAAPHRSWSFALLEGRGPRRVMEAALYDWTSYTWALPVWPDASALTAPLAAGATSVPIDPTDLDYRVGGLALLWTGPRAFELVEVDSLGASVGLRFATQQAWPAGTRVWPCRISVLADPPELERRSDRVIRSRARFHADEPCDWPSVAPTATYLGIPVLEDRPNERQSPTQAYGRDIERMDGDTGLPWRDDISGMPRPRQSQHWTPHGRRERAALRSLLYWLDGRAQALWVPTWADDIELLEPAGGTTLTVVWSGISLSLRRQPGRRHLRIELAGGTVLYRGVDAVDELDAERETILLATSLGQTIQPAQVRQISWLQLMRLSSDQVSISHRTDSMGVADARTIFVGAGAEEP